MLAGSTLVILIITFFLVALLYASVGFGGGSSYLAILSLFLPNFFEIKTIALLSNLVVVSSGSFLFIQRGFFDRQKFLPLVILSVPAAFLASYIHLTQTAFFITLGIVLIVSGILLIIQMLSTNIATQYSFTNNKLFNVSLGASIGFLSGLVGIGGGILLSPILNLLNWDNAKKIAALASFFILVNSISGLLGLIVNNTFKADFRLLFLLLLAVFVGGQFGTRLSMQLLKPSIVKGLTGLLVFYIGIKLVLKYTLAVEI